MLLLARCTFCCIFFLKYCVLHVALKLSEPASDFCTNSACYMGCLAAYWVCIYTLLALCVRQLLVAFLFIYSVETCLSAFVCSVNNAKFILAISKANVDTLCSMQKHSTFRGRSFSKGDKEQASQDLEQGSTNQSKQGLQGAQPLTSLQQQKLALPFTPLTMTFDDVHYLADLPAVSLS